MHEQTLLAFFDKMDADGNGEVQYYELEVGLDTLSSRIPSYYTVALGIKEELVDLEDGLVTRAAWIRACDNAVIQAGESIGTLSSLLPHLARAVTALDRDKVLRRAQQRLLFGNSLVAPDLTRTKKRLIYGRSLDVPELGQEEFPKQRIEGVSTKKLEMAGLRRFEPCPEGYSFVDATLGSGAFARVFLVQSQATGELRAMKRIDRRAMMKNCNLTEEDVVRRIEHEFRHLQLTDHPHIVKLLDFGQDSRYSYFIMEAASGGDLKKLVDHAYSRLAKPGKGSADSTRKLTEAYVADVLEQTAHALHTLHLDGRIHMDVKLENLMLRSAELNRPDVVLIDLGFTENLPEYDGEVPMPAGTPHTMAPEVIETHLGKRPAGFDERCDLYSLGVVAFELLVGRPPYEPVYKGPPGPREVIDYEATLARIADVDLTTPLRQEAGRSQACLDLVRQLMAYRPEDRPSALECLRHDWLLKQGALRQARAARGAPTAQPLDANSAQWQCVLAQTRAASRVAEVQRAAAHLAARVPVSRLRRAEALLAAVGQQLCQKANREERAKILQDTLGVDEACARYVAPNVGAEGAHLEDFARACASLCAQREELLISRLFTALDAAGDRGLTLGEALGALERAAGGRLRRTDVAEWLGAAFPAVAGGSEEDAKLCREALERHFRAGGGARLVPAAGTE